MVTTLKQTAVFWVKWHCPGCQDSHGRYARDCEDFYVSPAIINRNVISFNWATGMFPIDYTLLLRKGEMNDFLYSVHM